MREEKYKFKLNEKAFYCQAQVGDIVNNWRFGDGEVKKVIDDYLIGGHSFGPHFEIKFSEDNTEDNTIVTLSALAVNLVSRKEKNENNLSTKTT